MLVGLQILKNGLAMGVKIGGDTSSSGNNTLLLVIICVRLLQKIGQRNLTNSNQLRKGNGQK